MAKKDDKADGEDAKDPKDSVKETERIVDGIEAKMREQMAEVKRRQEVDEKRASKIVERSENVKKAELKRIADYKQKVQAQEAKKQNAANERALILKTKQEERLKAEERQREEDGRLRNVRERHVVAWEQKQLEWLQAH